MTNDKEKAKKTFLQLMQDYGVSWTDKVPESAWEELKRVESLLSEDEKKDLLINRFQR